MFDIKLYNKPIEIEVKEFSTLVNSAPIRLIRCDTGNYPFFVKNSNPPLEQAIRVGMHFKIKLRDGFILGRDNILSRDVIKYGEDNVYIFNYEGNNCIVNGTYGSSDISIAIYYNIDSPYKGTFIIDKNLTRAFKPGKYKYDIVIQDNRPHRVYTQIYTSDFIVCQRINIPLGPLDDINPPS